MRPETHTTRTTAAWQTDPTQGTKTGYDGCLDEGALPGSAASDGGQARSIGRPSALLVSGPESWGNRSQIEEKRDKPERNLPRLPRERGVTAAGDSPLPSTLTSGSLSNLARFFSLKSSPSFSTFPLLPIFSLPPPLSTELAALYL